MLITKKLVQKILAHYPQAPNGIHGITHWARVLENGRRLASATGAKKEVVELFAVFHDSKRINEGTDPDHGRRGAEFAGKLRGEYFRLSDADFELLYQACALHTDGLCQADITIQVCWDSDRLDLGRVSKEPDPEKLCLEASRDKNMLNWANCRSEGYAVPALIREEWGVEFYPSLIVLG